MSDAFLQNILDTNVWNFEQPADSKAEKIKKQIGRKGHKHLEATNFLMKNKKGARSSGAEDDAEDVQGQSDSDA